MLTRTLSTPHSSSATIDLNESGGDRNKTGTPSSSRSQSRSGSRAGTGAGLGSSHSIGSVTFDTDVYTEHDPDDMDDYSGTTKNSLSPTPSSGGSKSPKKLRYAVNDGRAMGMVHHQDDSKGGGEGGGGGGGGGSRKGSGSSSEGGSFRGAKNESKHAGNAAPSGLLSIETNSRGSISNPHNKAESKEQGKDDRRLSKKDQQAQGLFGSPGRQS